MDGFYIILQLLMVIPPIQICCGQQLQNGDIRFASGPNGPLEIYMDDNWFSVCCTDFSDDAATTVCRQMNLGTHGKSHPSAEKPTQPASYNITCPALKDYTNYGPTHVLRCQVEQIDCDCKTDVVCNEGAQVHYNGEVILERDEAYSEGELHLYYNNQKFPVCCDSSFNQAAADSACRQLGYTGSHRPESINGKHQTSSWVICSTCTSGSYACLKSCINFTAIKTDQCDPCKLRCTYDTSVDKIYSSGSQSECMINVDTHVQDSTPWKSIAIGFTSAFGVTILILIIIIIVVLIIIFVCCCRLIRMCYHRWRNNDYEQPLDDHR